MLVFVKCLNIFLYLFLCLFIELNLDQCPHIPTLAREDGLGIQALGPGRTKEEGAHSCSVMIEKFKSRMLHVN